MTGEQPATKADLEEFKTWLSSALLVILGAATSALGFTTYAPGGGLLPEFLLYGFSILVVSVAFATRYDGLNRSIWTRVPGVNVDDRDDLEVPP